MYVRASHKPRSDADVLEVMSEHLFATLVTHSREGMMASHLPFLFDSTRGMLLAHMARANPQSAVLDGDEEALVLFLGPHGYISPSWYEDRATAPTWDYVAVHCHGRIRVHSGDEARKNIERLVSVMEASSATPWSIAELTEDDARQLLQNVVSFEIAVTRMEGKFKLNRGEQPARTRAAIAELEKHGNEELATYIRRYNDL